MQGSSKFNKSVCQIKQAPSINNLQNGGTKDTMGKKNLVDVLNQTPEIAKLLKPKGGSFMPKIKTIGMNSDFQTWKTELKQLLQNMEQTPLIVDILQVLEDGFKNGFTDERDFVQLQSKLNVLSEHLNDYYPVKKGEDTMSPKLKKGTVIKTAFDEYTLIEQVGSGGNGRVFSAENGKGDNVAIKFVERSISSDKLKRFKNEIHFCERHKHDNIVEILDRGYAVLDDTEYVFYVMPLYSKTLRQKIKEKLAPEQALDIFLGLIKGLEYAHKCGTIHRDIKPENIMFSADSLEPIICDFGIAHFAEEELLTVIETKKGDRMANFQYAAPEQRVKGKKATPQTDIYAASLILNEMFTGEIPQAADHKTIASVAPDYKFLDDVFAQMFRQEASDRLYPEEKILTEIKVRATLHKREQEKLKLQRAVDASITPEEFIATIIGKEYHNGNIVFTLDRELPSEWVRIITGGHLGNYSAMLGYEPERLKTVGKCAISIPVHGSESADSLKRIVENVMDWITKANSAYSSHLKRIAQQEQLRKEAERKAAIEKIEKDNKLAAIIAEL